MEEPVASIFMVDKLGTSVSNKHSLSLFRVKEIGSRPLAASMFRVEEISVCYLKVFAGSVFSIQETVTTISDLLLPASG